MPESREANKKARWCRVVSSAVRSNDPCMGTRAVWTSALHITYSSYASGLVF